MRTRSIRAITRYLYLASMIFSSIGLALIVLMADTTGPDRQLLEFPTRVDGAGKEVHHRRIRSLDRLVRDGIIPTPLEGDISNATKIVVFDASDYKGSLAFLDRPAKGWAVATINVRASQLDTCGHCHVLTKSWAASFLGKHRVKRLESGVILKMAAYLFLLTFKPAWLFVTSKPHTVPYASLDRVARDEERKGLVYAGSQKGLFQPCSHFMDPFLWRGPSLNKSPPSRYTLRRVSSASIYQVVNECFPRRLKLDNANWKTLLDQRAALPYVMSGVFAVLDFDNILVPNQAAWTLVASLGKRFTKTSIFLNLVVQRALWETDSHVGFIPSEPVQKKCALCSLMASHTTFSQPFRNELVKTKCEKSLNVTACFMHLYELIRRKDEEKSRTTSNLEAWIRFLDDFGISMPKRVPVTKNKLVDNLRGRRSFFTPAKSFVMSNVNVSASLDPFSQICKRDNESYPSFIPRYPPYRDVLVLIVIRKLTSINHQIPMLEYWYGRYFSHVVYCSNNIEVLADSYKENLKRHPITFVSVDDTSNSQECATAAMQMNYNVSGYFQITDDVLVNPWQFHTLPFKRPWLSSDIKLDHVTPYSHSQSDGNANNNNYHSLTPPALLSADAVETDTPLASAWKELNKLKSDVRLNPRISKFLETSYNNSGCRECTFSATGDVFYIPASISEDFGFFSDLFQRFRVGGQISVMAAIGGLVPLHSIYRLRRHCDREPMDKIASRSTYFNYSRCQFDHIWRPVNLANSSWPKFFCKNVLQRYDQDLKVLRNSTL